MINKRSSNTGASGGNGMQEFTIEYLMDVELYHEYKGGHTSSCAYCGEVYHLAPGHNMLEALQLDEVLRADGCPFCNRRDGLTSDFLNWFMENKGKVLQFQFEIKGGKLIDTYRKPNGWKPINKTALREALDEQQ